MELDDPEVENIHITVREPYIAAEMIEQGIMVKTACINFETIKDQYFWTVSFDTFIYPTSCKERQGVSKHHIIMNWPLCLEVSLGDELAVKTTDYEVHKIENTNIFVVMRKFRGDKESYCTCPSESVSNGLP